MAMKSVTGNVDDLMASSARWRGFASRFIYRPATLWLGWIFVASVAGTAFLFILLYRIWDTLRPPQDYLLSLSPYALAVALPLVFFIIYAGLQYTVARGFFMVLGDASIYHVNQLTPLGVLVTKDEFEAFDDPDLSKDVAYIGKTVVRHKVRLWGRLGGVKNWPGWDGGKRDGYFDVVYDFWDEVDGKKIVLKKRCRACDGSGEIDVRGHEYTAVELEMLKNITPGVRMGTTLVLPYEAWPVDMDEIPEELALAIRGDPEWRVSSRVWDMESPLPGRLSLGSAMPSNMMVRAWATERANRVLRDRVLEVTMQLAMLRGMGEETTTGGPPSLGATLGSGRGP